MGADHYEICVRDRLGPELMHALAEFAPEVRGHSTVLHTAGSDQPSLHGALDRLAQFGLEIVSVERAGTPDR